MKRISGIISWLFYVLFFFVPLILFPTTSELFEFNKIITLYLLTTLIASIWIIKMIVSRKFLLRTTPLDFPLLIFLGSQVLATVTSIDTRTSFFGYYSRFNGGLLSSICYAILYWAYVSNMDRKKTLKAIYMLLASAFLVAIYGVLEHYGIDRDLWVQDVQTRVFSTLGQPNWLAAWLVALMPITWALSIKSKVKSINFWVWILLSSLFFLTLLYTRSRSGLLGFASATALFWPIVFFFHKGKVNLKTLMKPFLILNSLFVILALASGTPWTPSMQELINKNKSAVESQLSQDAKPAGPALEVGGTESGQIRKIVWRGALKLWRDYPILGTGVETFAFSYYKARPVEHNLVSEWEYLYNKAHNEYLNFAATTGTLGLLSYLFLIGGIIFQIAKELRIKNYELSDKTHSSFFILHSSLLAGFASILVTNFFGFSVVPVSLLFFLYPAFAVSLGQESKRVKEQEMSIKSSTVQKIGIFLSIILTSYSIILIARYWYADLLYAKGKLENDSANFASAKDLLDRAILFSPNEAVYWDELSQASTQIALALNEEGQIELAKKFTQMAIAQSDESIKLSPANVNLKRTRASMFIKLSTININYLLNARDTLISAAEQAPNDAQMLYNLALAYVRTDEVDKALVTLQKTVEVKKNYRNAWLAMALLHIDSGHIEKAKQELMYILENFEPDDPIAKQELEELEK